LPLQFSDPVPGPEEQAIRAASVADVRRVMERMPEEWQIVVAMRSQGYASKEIASDLGKSDDAIRIIHCRAMKRLGHELGRAPRTEDAR
jgi:DNA-directed RNA polymerase specialized sigma24 family protein